MKKKFFALCTVCVLLLSLAACGGSAGGADMNSAVSMDQTAPSAPTLDFAAGAEKGWDMPAEAPSPEPTSPEGGYGEAGSTLPSGTKIIYTADIDLETKEFDAASQAIAGAVRELGGYFESRSVNQGGHYRSLNCTIRVPVEKFHALLDRAGEAAHVTNRSEYLEDVSEVYYDQEARLTTQRTKLDRLQELLSKAESMEDIITLESAISETELQIEYLTGSLRKYDSLINYSTVNLYLREVYRLSTDEEVPVTFGQRLSAAFSSGFYSGVAWLDDFAIFVARSWMSLLILAVIIVVVVLLLRRRKRRRAERLVQPDPKEDSQKAPENTDKAE